MSKIALGTAQFGLPYGISNTHGQVDRTEMDEIWQVARGANITMLDTAIAYGNSEENIGATKSVGFDIVTKLPRLPGAETSITQWVHSQIKNSLAKLKRNSVYGLLLHIHAYWCVANKHGAYYNPSILGSTLEMSSL